MVRKSPKSGKTLTFILVFMIAVLLVLCGIKLTKKHADNVKDPSPEVEEDIKPPSENEPTVELPKFIDLQAVVDEWADSVGGNVGIYVYDLDNEKEAGSHNSEDIFYTASVYKLFFVYEAYLRIANGTDDPNAYFADGKTRIECLDLIIRESYNPCADPLRNEMRNEIEEIISDKYKIENISGGAIYASPEAIAEMLKIYYKHEDLPEDLWNKIADSMLNQPTTTYNWRQGLPTGFSTANVYDKVGWYSEDGTSWSNYNDAAIVEFSDLKRHYIVVVLTEKISPKKIAQLGFNIEQTILANNQ